MPRFYNNCMRPSANKAVNPGEKKAKKPSGGAPGKGKGKGGTSAPGTDNNDQEEAENAEKKDEGGGK